MTEQYTWTDNPTLSGVALCNTDVLNECLMHLKYDNSGRGGLELCDIGTSLYVDETKGLRRRLNGSIMDITSNYQAFLTRLKEITTLYPNLVCTEDEWQTTKTMSKLGQCGKFVYNYGTDGDTITSIRLPLVININGLADMAKCGLIKDESLPNITLYQTGAVGANVPTNNGALIYTPGGVGVQGASSSYVNSNGTFDFNASRSSSTYQDNAPVQQDAIQYPYFIQVATGSETENNIVNDIELNNPTVLFTSHYVEAPLYNISWLKSDGEYHPKARYIKAYEALVVEQNTDIAVGTTVDLPSGTKYTKRGLSVKLSSASDITDYDFVINTTNESFRLPLKNGIEGVFANRVKGNGLALGLTDGTSNVGVYMANGPLSASTGAFGQPISTIPILTGYINNGIIGVTTDPTKSGIVVDTTVPEGWNLYYYVGETVQNANLIDAGRIGEELGNKTNAKQAASASAPNYEKAYLYQATINTIFTAPCDGILMGVISTGKNAGESFIDIYNPDGQIINTVPYGYSGADVNQYSVNIKLLKDYSAKATCSTGGDIYYATTDHTAVSGKLQFIPLKGAN